VHPVSPDVLLFISAFLFSFFNCTFQILEFLVFLFVLLLLLLLLLLLYCVVSLTYRSQCCVAGANRRAGIALVGGALEKGGGGVRSARQGLLEPSERRAGRKHHLLGEKQKREREKKCLCEIV